MSEGNTIRPHQPKVHHNGLTTTIYGELEYNKKSREQDMQMSCYYSTKYLEKCGSSNWFFLFIVRII